MSALPPIDRILQTLRAQALPAQADRVATQRRDGPVESRRRETGTNVANYLAQRIAQIGQDDPQRRRRVFRAFLEGALVKVWGVTAASDAEFQRLVDRVDDAMQTNPEFARASERVVDALLEASASKNADLAALAADLFGDFSGS